MAGLLSQLNGATSILSIVAALFFLRFWWRTGDLFFLLFAAAFVIDAISRFVLGLDNTAASHPLAYLPRLLMFGVIIAAVVHKNRQGR